ncbi:endothelin-2 [Betta splendens]|uniref:Endothelin-2 n=1 Tax=Betta splendens TaxID=158456 RepID=A0A6P7P0Y1_BETSP|nr:endothelin-2 [Betta splendens]
MDSFKCKTLILFLLCVSLQEGCGLPLSDGTELPAQAQAPHPHVRTKRCSCSNWEDKECVYFCHLDIIWVNTPSKLLPYGLGSFLSRGRRSVNRCQCLGPDDETCSRFCSESSENPSTDAIDSEKAEKTTSNKLLASFRSVVKSNTAAARDLSLKQNSDGVSELMGRTRR